MTPVQALPTAYLPAAHLLNYNWDNQIGSIEKGRSMKKQFVLTRSGLSGIGVGVLIMGFAVWFVAQSGQRGPATPAAPCGPSIVGELGTNTAKNSCCFELRMYTVDPSKS